MPRLLKKSKQEAKLSLADDRILLQNRLGSN